MCMLDDPTINALLLQPICGGESVLENSAGGNQGQSRSIAETPGFSQLEVFAGAARCMRGRFVEPQITHPRCLASASVACSASQSSPGATTVTLGRDLKMARSSVRGGRSRERRN